MRLISSLLFVAVLATGTASLAADDDAPPEPRDKIATLIVYGNDPCPRSTDDEIVVCGREPESERYRIPKRLRKTKESAQGRSWTDRVRTLETVSRAGLPNSCSPSGSNGQTGGFEKLLQQARDERRQAASQGSDIP